MNPDDHNDLIEELVGKRKQQEQGGGQARKDAQHKRGKLTARERIHQLLDPGSFHEMDGFRTHRHDKFGMDEQRYPGDSVITGYGKIDGRMVCVYAQDFTVLGGSFSEVQGQKVSKIIDLAIEAGAPVIGIMDSVGARIQEGVYSLAAYSELFWRNTQASGVIPQISLMVGPCAGGSVYAPGLTDFVIMTEGTSHMFITGPKVIETVTREKIGLDELGGARVHSEVSGVAHFSAGDEAQAFEMTRTLLGYLPSSNRDAPPSLPPDDDPWRMDEQLNTLAPTDPAEPYDVRAVIERVFDLGSYFPVHARFARNAEVGFARLHGRTIAVVATQPLVKAGALDIDASDKIARFIRFSDAFNLPIITFVDTPGFMPGSSQEHGGIIRHGAKIVYAYSEATVPKLAVITRKAFGGAYIVMSSKHVRADVVYAWPTAEIAVMGAEGAVEILYGDRPDAEKEKELAEYREQFSKPYYAAATGHVDEVLIPAETRPRLISALELLRDKKTTGPDKKHGNMPM
jgi:acetyl-CoA carboxylase carboxyltransferase component